MWAEENDNFGTCLVKTYDVPNQQVRVFFTNADMAERLVQIDIYFIA